MWTGNSKYSLAVLLFTCICFLVYSDARATPNEYSRGAFSSAVSSASAFTGAFGGTGNFPGIQDGHKEIRSYDSTGFSHDNVADHDAKSYSTPSGHGAGHEQNIKGGGHDYNVNGDGCSKCKWENDDYWEQDEPEEEQNEDECDDGDDGQYRPYKAQHHGASGSRGPAPDFHPYQSGVYKQGPTDSVNTEVNTGIKRGRPAASNFPTNAGHAGSNSGFGGITPKPGTGWNTPFTSKPGYSSAIAGASGTIPSSWPSWNTGTMPSFGSSSKPAWNNGYSSTSIESFITTPKSESNWNIGSERKPGQGWNTNAPTTGFPFSRKPAPSWNAHDSKLGGHFGTTPIPRSNWNTGFSSTSTELPLQKSKAPWTGHDGRTTSRPGQSWNKPIGFNDKPGSNRSNPNYGAMPINQSDCTRSDSSCNQGKQGPIKVGATPIRPTFTGSNIPSDNYGNPNQNQYMPYGQGTQSTNGVGTSTTSSIASTSHGKIPDFEKKDHPFGFDKPTYSQVPYDNKPYASGVDQYSNTGIYGPGNTFDHDKSKHGIGSHDTWPSNVASFENTKRPYEGINSPTAISGAQGVTKPSYGTSTYSWSTPGQIGSSWHGPESTGPHVGSPTSNTRPPTKTPFSYGNISGSTLSGSPYVGTGLKQSGFNMASSSSTANAAASAFATFGIHNIPGIIETTPSYGTTLAHGRDISYSGVKSSPGNIRPYGTPYNTQSNTGNAWPDKQPDTGSGTSPRYPETGSTWPTRQPESNNEPREKSGITSGRYPGNDGRIWPSGKPESTSGIIFGGHPGITDNSAKQSGSGFWPIRKPGDGSNITPSRYPGSVTGTTPSYSGTETESGCSSVTCEGSPGAVGGSSNCGSGNYNCNSNCNEGNSATAHKSCGPNRIDKTYYPAGTGNVPNLGGTYQPSSSPNVNIGTYPGTGCKSGDNSCTQVGGANVISEEPIRWNPANPFLYGVQGGFPSDVSRPWNSGTTVKPLGKENPFLNSNWNTSESGYNVNDKNVIPLGGGNNKPFGQGNPFLDKTKGNVDINANEGPLGGRKPEKNNPFIRPGSGNNPLYGEHSVGSPGLGVSKNDNYGNKNDNFHLEGILPQDGSNTGPYSIRENSPSPLQCKLGIFGCGTSASGSYAPTKGKHPGGSFGGIDGFTNSGVGIGYNPVPGSTGNNLVGSTGAHSGTYAGSFSNAQASSFASANSLSSSGTPGAGNNFGQAYGGSWSSSGAQNQGAPNSWASSGASAFASSSSGSWPGNHPTGVKG